MINLDADLSPIHGTGENLESEPGQEEIGRLAKSIKEKDERVLKKRSDLLRDRSQRSLKAEVTEEIKSHSPQKQNKTI